MTPDTARAQQLRQNIEAIRETIRQSCRRSGRDPAAVRLVAVTKYVSLDLIRELLRIGVTDLGESRVQQLVSRAEALREIASESIAAPAPPQPCWHMIGHLQRNKVKALLPCAQIIHSLDSARLAEELEKQAGAFHLTVEALLEVNVSGEASKTGLAPQAVEPLLEAVAVLPHVRPIGLMTMAPLNADPETARPHFARLRALLETLQKNGAGGPALQHLSMGMSQDYAVAVEEGATLVRIGSALFEGIINNR